VSITWDVVQQPVSGEIISLEDSEIFEVCAGNPIEVFVINGIGGVNGTDIIEWGYSNPDPVASLDTFVAFPNTTGSIGWYPATMPFIAPAFTDNNNNFIRFNLHFRTRRESAGVGCNNGANVATGPLFRITDGVSAPTLAKAEIMLPDTVLTLN